MITCRASRLRHDQRRAARCSRCRRARKRTLAAGPRSACSRRTTPTPFHALRKNGAEHRQKRAEGLRKKLARIDVSERALVSELETPVDPADAAAQALRNRVRARFTELYTERTGIETELATLETAPIEQDDPTLLDELPALGDILTGAPAALTERLLAAFDIQAVYNRDKHQVTIHATLTDATPQAVLDLLSDPRADHNRQLAPQPESAPAPQDHVAHLTGHTGSSPRASTLQDSQQDDQQNRGDRGCAGGSWPGCGALPPWTPGRLDSGPRLTGPPQRAQIRCSQLNGESFRPVMPCTWSVLGLCSLVSPYTVPLTNPGYPLECRQSPRLRRSARPRAVR